MTPTGERTMSAIRCDTCDREHPRGTPARGWYIVDTQTQCPDHHPARARAAQGAATEARIAKLTQIADQAWTCVALDKHNDAPFNEAFDELARLCKEYQPLNVDPMLVALTVDEAP